MKNYIGNFEVEKDNNFIVIHIEKRSNRLVAGIEYKNNCLDIIYVHYLDKDQLFTIEEEKEFFIEDIQEKINK